MKDDDDFYTLSHDEADFPTYTHEIMITMNIFASSRVVGIIDLNPEHRKFLTKWTFKEVDIDSRYWLADGQLGGHYRIYDGPNSFTLEYIFKLTIEQAELIADNPYHVLGVCSPSGGLYFLGKSFSIDDLKKFIKIKKKVDKDPNPPKLWKVG